MLLVSVQHIVNCGFVWLIIMLNAIKSAFGLYLIIYFQIVSYGKVLATTYSNVHESIVELPHSYHIVLSL